MVARTNVSGGGEGRNGGLQGTFVLNYWPMQKPQQKRTSTEVNNGAVLATDGVGVHRKMFVCMTTWELKQEDIVDFMLRMDIKD
ncbi:hypothetical protein JHK85_051052 [Glycine max]|nr:hypothetical protein JHK85_051052 [Glycine max]